jgi:hypothetical protein
MLESLVLLATVVAVLAGAASTYGRVQARRLQILKALEGETVVLGIRGPGGNLRFIHFVRARVLAAPRVWNSDARVEISVIDFDDRNEAPPSLAFLERWEEYGVVLHDVLSVETLAGEIYRF